MIKPECLACARLPRVEAQQKKCWIRRSNDKHSAGCSRKRSYYNNLEENRKKLRLKHRYIKFKGDACVICKTRDRLEVHHIIPQQFGGQDTEQNTITLCTACHDTVTAYNIAVMQKNTLGDRIK